MFLRHERSNNEASPVLMSNTFRQDDKVGELDSMHLPFDSGMRHHQNRAASLARSVFRRCLLASGQAWNHLEALVKPHDFKMLVSNAMVGQFPVSGPPKNLGSGAGEPVPGHLKPSKHPEAVRNRTP